ncbi:prepilin-type N-terminal cleavage/methylation domain-containing protein [Verrucomicrobium sp. BvORR106]|uniref:pilus assembly FimT family protein n=1 Tax=Verrucomicrobium sp. BvORR106 TaxID=1403819 RepID=UPI0005706631|nr:prepilin-type N-terminal cleavage/methylation domain-containing protein [Verrucomicrobium sp. BvORR106]
MKRPPKFHPRPGLLPHPHLRPLHAGFTLVELLLVTAVIAVLLGVGIGSFSGTIRGMSLTNGGNKITMVFEAARQRAMAGNVLTAAILLTNAGTEEDGRAWTVVEYPEGGPAWVQIRDWELLPTGISVDIGNGTGHSDSFVSLTKTFPFNGGSTSAPIQYRGKALAQGQYAARVFLPSGGVLNAGDAAQLQIVEGTMTGGKTQYSKPTGPDNYYRISLLTSTGRTKVERPSL